MISGAEMLTAVAAAPDKKSPIGQRLATLDRLAAAFDRKVPGRQQAPALEKYFREAAALMRAVIDNVG